MTQQKTFYVKVKGKRERILVKADYFRVEGGALWFRNTVYNAYPAIVCCFAAGAWTDVWADANGVLP